MVKISVSEKRQHEAVRDNVGYHNFTHELVEISGEDSGAFLDDMYPAAISRTKVGRGKYTTQVNESGIIIDDLIIFRLDDHLYWISTLYSEQLIECFDQYKASYNIEYKIIAAENEMYTVQGPKSKDLLNRLVDKPVDDIGYFAIQDRKIEDVNVKVARAGYTGEKGYEIYIAAEHKDFLEAKLEEAGKPLDATHITESNVFLYSLPSEKGFVLMSDINETNPLESELDFSIDWSKNFIGKEALDKVKAEGPQKILLGFTVEDTDSEIDEDTPILKNGDLIGKATRFTYGYTIEKAIGYALVDRSAASIGDTVDIGGVTATLTDRIWYDVENEKMR